MKSIYNFINKYNYKKKILFFTIIIIIIILVICFLLNKKKEKFNTNITNSMICRNNQLPHNTGDKLNNINNWGIISRHECIQKCIDEPNCDGFLQENKAITGTAECYLKQDFNTGPKVWKEDSSIDFCYKEEPPTPTSYIIGEKNSMCPTNYKQVTNNDKCIEAANLYNINKYENNYYDYKMIEMDETYETTEELMLVMEMVLKSNYNSSKGCHYSHNHPNNFSFADDDFNYGGIEPLDKPDNNFSFVCEPDVTTTTTIATTTTTVPPTTTTTTVPPTTTTV